jgi:hypothetical protein
MRQTRPIPASKMVVPEKLWKLKKYIAPPREINPKSHVTMGMSLNVMFSCLCMDALQSVMYILHYKNYFLDFNRYIPMGEGL